MSVDQCLHVNKIKTRLKLD